MKAHFKPRHTTIRFTLFFRSFVLLLAFVVCSSLAFAQTDTTATNSPVTSPKIYRGIVTFGQRVSAAKRPIDVVIVHSTYCNDPTEKDSFSFPCVISQFRKYGVSAHYVIDRLGNIIQLVEDNNVSYHGGKGTLPDNDTHINTRSIGIEIITTEKGYVASAQYKTLTALVRYLKQRYPIKYVLRHSDVAPTRKTDPWGFNWDAFNKTLEN